MTIKAVLKVAREAGIELAEMEVPDVGDTDVLVKVCASSLCGSDLHIYEWTPGYESRVNLPIVLGHEFAGEVVAVGARVGTLAAGERVTVFPHMACGRCGLCQVGRGDSCKNKADLGLTMNGALAEFVRLTGAARVYKLPENMSYETAALCEPLSVALNAVDLSGTKPGYSAAVLGPGPIGLFTLQVLKASGAGPVMVVGTASDRRRLGVAEALGADVVVDIGREDPVSVASRLARRGVDVVFEATGDPRAVPQALAMVRARGKVLMMGIHEGLVQFDPNDVVRRMKSIVGAYAYQPDTWYRSLALLSSGRVATDQMITHRLPLVEAEEGFRAALAKEAIKVVFTP
ncbi:MAG: alcohol dehydrogenase catalytic domain-containing protein [Thermoleophilia bacterium]|nr:alcohol dehydrogenase catalytic domain-containing protein [Thermoleophilia bacterium]